MTNNLVDELAQLEEMKAMRDGLPHLYCFKLYPWQREVWDAVCNNPLITLFYLFAANQVGKSSLMIRLLIHFCTEPKLWKRFKRKPKSGMYFYPDKHTLKREVTDKWEEFLPRNGYENHPQYGYKIVYEGQFPSHIEFNTGIVCYFRTYGGSKTGGNTANKIQATTPAFIFADEEVPESIADELLLRISSPANAGAFWMQLCTPTLGQIYLRKIQEGKTKLPNSFVKTISMYDCLEYEDGTKSIWTKKKIQEIEQRLPNQRAIEVRIHGLFRPDTNLAFPSFERERNVKPSHPLKGWRLQCGIDYGIGGSQGGHPSAITFVAVNPDCTQARVVHTWRSSKVRTVTVDEVIEKYLSMCGDLGVHHTAVTTYYDWGCGEMGVIAERRGLGFLKAVKDRRLGFDTLNSVFKNNMLHIYEYGGWEGLVEEIETYQEDSKINDDQIDSLRYAISEIIFNFENIVVGTDPNDVKPTPKRKGKPRRGEKIEDDWQEDDYSAEDEINEWNGYFEG